MLHTLIRLHGGFNTESLTPGVRGRRGKDPRYISWLWAEHVKDEGLHPDASDRSTSTMCTFSVLSSASCSSSQTGWQINGYLGKPGEGKLWKIGCHIGPVSRRNGLISITGSNAYGTGNKCLHYSVSSHFTLPNITPIFLLSHKFHDSVSIPHGIASSSSQLWLEGQVGGEEPSTLLCFSLYQVYI